MPLDLKNTPPYYTIDDTSPITKYYKVLITQTGTATPTKTELTNTIGTFTITRVSEGIYDLTTDGLLTANKTFIEQFGTETTANFQNIGYASTGYMNAVVYDTDKIRLYTVADLSFTPKELSTIAGSAEIYLSIIIKP